MDPIILVCAGLAGMAAIAIVLGVRAVVDDPRAEVLDRAQRVTRVSRITLDSPVAALQSGRSLWATLLGPLGSVAQPKDEEEASRARRTLVHAGFRGERAVEIFFGCKVAFALALGGGLLLASSLRATPIPKAQMLAVVLVAVGFYAPNVWLGRRVRARQTALSRSLADTLDLLVTCVEAGLPLDAALARIGQEIGLSAPELSSELRLTTMEIQAGVARADAFRRMAARTGVEDLRSLSAVIIQTEMFGTTVGRALRVHSATMRTRRTHAAEEKAAIAVVKMLVPLILFILPSLFTIILGPAIVRIITTLFPSLHGHQ